MIPDHLKAQVRESPAAIATMSSYVQDIRIRGRVATGLCPIHNEKTGSFTIKLTGHPRVGTFHCHGCHANGDVFDMLRIKESLTYHQAMKQVADDAGITLPGYKPPSAEERRQWAAEALEREMAVWWFRQRWMDCRRALDAGMAEHDVAWLDCCGRMLRWIERVQGTDEGIAAFSAVRTSRVDAGYARWKRDEVKRLQRDRVRILGFMDRHV